MNIEQLIGKMTLKQKLAQMTQLNATCLHIGAGGELTGPAADLSLERDEIAATGSVLNFRGADEMIAIQREHLESDPNRIPLLFMQDVVHGYRTIYPIPLAMGASFDTALAEECCAMASDEMSLGGVHVAFAPMVDLVRDPRWGRCMESTGEDPFLNSDMARAMVRGIRRSGKVAACVKHFAAYGQAEAGRDYNTTDMSERTLRDAYLPAYRAAVDEGVDMVMTSFNILNGVPSSGNRRLVKGILRDEWGFDKVVISDYNAFREMKTHGYCETEKDCAERAIAATGDIEMMSACYLHEIPRLIEEGKVSEAQVDEAVRRVLRLKEKLGLLENPFLAADAGREASVCLSEGHREIARKMAEESAVLLKNEGVLPFDGARTGRVAVIGPFADRVMLGSWSCHGREEDGVSVLAGVKKLLRDAEVCSAAGCGKAIRETDCGGVAEAASLAATCDCAILCVGEDPSMSGEGVSRAELRLSPAQKALIREVVRANPHTVAVLFCGRPLVLTDIIDDVPALVVAWQPGTEGGNALARLLWGEVNFSAKLPMSFPRSEGQIPVYYNSFRTGRPWESAYGSWYQDMSKTPLFPFGYGIGYTTFSVSSPELSSSCMERGETMHVSVSVRNTGDRAGEDVIQLYICDDYASLVRPVKELKGYVRLHLEPGESRTVTFPITEDTLRFWSENGRFEAEDGSFTVWVSDSSNVTGGVSFRLRRAVAL